MNRRIISQLSMTLFLMVFCGCQRGPVLYKPVPVAPLVTKEAQAAGHVRAAKAEFAKAAVTLRAAQTSHTRTQEAQAEATRWVTILVPAVQELLLKVPAELHAEVLELASKVEKLSAEIARATTGMGLTRDLLAEVQTEQRKGGDELEKANAAHRELTEAIIPQLIAENEKLAQAATHESAERAAAQAELRAIHSRSWLHKIALGLGALAVAGLLFLWFTGRIATALK
jgi:chromosome segregation ATPase